MASRVDRHDYETEQNNSRVAKNQDLYRKLYEEDSYVQPETNPSLERTTEIDIEKVRELLRGREIYRKEMKMREYNILKPEVEKEEEQIETEEKRYDINEYLNKASNEKEFQPYHKLDIEHVAPVEEDEKEEEEASATVLEKMGNTELSLDMFGDLSETDNEEEDETEEIEEVEADEEIETEEEGDSEEDEDSRDVDDTFFTGSIKIHLSDNTDEDEEEETNGSSLFVKIIMVILIIIIIALVAFLLFL